MLPCIPLGSSFQLNGPRLSAGDVTFCSLLVQSVDFQLLRIQRGSRWAVAHKIDGFLEFGVHIGSLAGVAYSKMMGRMRPR